MMMNRIFWFGAIVSPALLFCNPEGARIVSGEANVQAMDQGTLHIHAGRSAIIEWQKFSIGEGETARFIQPDAHSAVLNRVMGKEKSFLSGKLEANGKVFLINRNGILISKSGMINTGGFIASTHHLSDEEFLKQQEMNFKGDSLASLINYGTIEAVDGDVALIAHSVDNQGMIRASKGEVFLGAGGEVVLKPSGVDRLFIRLSEGTETKEEVGVHHAGVIEAIRAHLQADGNLCSLAINQEGLIDATGVVEKDGQVFLVAHKGNLQMTGSIAAKNSDGSGGEVRLLGDGVGLLGAASVDVTGETKGGTVLIGGDYQGKNPEIPNAKGVYIGEHASIDASGINDADGGMVILWSDRSTAFYGSINVEAGKEGGDGGFIEISSKGGLFPEGKISALAPHGKVGMLLLDPTDVTIVPPPTVESGFNAPPPPPPNYVFNANSANIDITNLNTFLLTADITVDSSISSGTAAGVISVTPPAFALAFPFTLTLSSPTTVVFLNPGPTLTNVGSGSMNVSAPNVTVSCPVSFSGGGNLSFNGSSGGVVQFLSSSNVTATNVSVSGGSFSTFANVHPFNSFSANVSGDALIGAGITVQSLTGPSSLKVGGTLTVNNSVLHSATTMNINAGNVNVIGAPGTVSAGNNLLMIAGNSISLTNGALVTSSGGSTSLVVDNSHPTSLGSGSFTIDATSSVNSALPNPLFIYSADQAQNMVDPAATFNGVTYTPAVTNVNRPPNNPPTMTSVFWGIFFPLVPVPAVPNIGVPATFFYKAGGQLTAQIAAIINQTLFLYHPTGPGELLITQDGIQSQLGDLLPYLGWDPIIRPIPSVDSTTTEFSPCYGL